MAKKLFRAIVALVLVLSLISITALAASGGTGTALYSNTTELADGFSYTNNISYNSSSARVEAFSLAASAESGVYPIIMACDTIYGGMTISKMISYAESQGYNVLGAVNTDFFSTTTKVPLGVVIENGEYMSSPSGENVLAFNDDGAFISASPMINISLKNNGGGEYVDETTGETVSNAGKTVALQHLNKSRADSGGLYLYTSAFSTLSTRTTTTGWAVRMKILTGSISVSGEMSLEVVDVIPSGTSYQIGDGYVVLTAAASCGMSSEMKKFAVGDTVTLTTTCSDSALLSAQWATGCGDIIVSGGSITNTSNWDSALFGYNPRTAIGIKSDGSIVCYVVDGRSSSYSNGAKMSELAADMIAAGCVYAVNMDGGGSTAMSVKLPGSSSCVVVNKPSDGAERSCSTYLLFVTDRVSDGSADRLYLKNDGIYVLAGSSTELSYLASDQSGAPAALPDSVTAVSGGLGSVSGTTYTAGTNAGNDIITLTSSSGASGYGTIHIITAADTFSVTNKATGKAPVLSNLEQGSTVQLSVSATRLTRSVKMDSSSVAYSVSGDIGTISQSGLFTASGTPGSTGTITISAAGLTKQLSVSLKTEFTDIAGHWAESYIQKLFDNGVVKGTGDLLFKPDDSIRRCDFTLMMWRAVGSPAVSGTSSFSDVAADSYYAQAVSWAESIGITNGSGDGKFNPTAALSREQAFTLIYRLLDKTGKSLPAPDQTVLQSFSDRGEVSSFAADAISSLVSYGMVEGSGGKLTPQKDISRAEMAKILCVAIY